MIKLLDFKFTFKHFHVNTCIKLELIETMTSQQTGKQQSVDDLSEELLSAIRSGNSRKVDSILEGQTHSLPVENIVNNVVTRQVKTTQSQPQGGGGYHIIEETENCTIHQDTPYDGPEMTTALIEALRHFTGKPSNLLLSCYRI